MTPFNHSEAVRAIGGDRIALTVDEAARQLGVGRQTLYNWLNAGKLTSVKVVGRRLIPLDALRDLLRPAA